MRTILILMSLGLFTPISAQVSVVEFLEVSESAGDFDGEFDGGGRLGSSLAAIGDLDGDGALDLAIGARSDGDFGSIWILFLDEAGVVDTYQKISDSTGGFGGELAENDDFGVALCAAGDIDDDGVRDLAVGARFSDDGGTDTGSIWVLFMNDDGTVSDEQEISDEEGSFGGALSEGDYFGSSVTSVGDLDGDDVPDLVVGAPRDGDGDRGAIWMLFMDEDGTVSDQQKINDEEGDFEGALADLDYFGEAVACLGDVDGDGVTDLAVGASGDADGSTFPPGNRGAVWILFLDEDGTVQSEQKISDTEGEFDAEIDDWDRFGFSLSGVGDLNSDDVPDLLVGAPLDDDGGAFENRGGVYVLLLNESGTVNDHQKISTTEGDFLGELGFGAGFGSAVAHLGDVDEDGMPEIVVGASLTTDLAGERSGAAWTLFLGYRFLRGDIDANGVVSALLDASYLMSWAFADGDDLPCVAAADVDANDSVSPLLDSLFLLNYAFLSGAAPADPGVEDCGPDPENDTLHCASDGCL